MRGHSRRTSHRNCAAVGSADRVSKKGRSDSPAVRPLGLPVGDIPPTETLLGPCVAVLTPSLLQKRTTSDTKRAYVRVPSPLGTNRPDAGTCGCTLNTMRTSRRRVEPSPRSHRWAHVLRRPPQCSDSPHHMTIPTSDKASYRDISKGCASTPPRLVREYIERRLNGSSLPNRLLSPPNMGTPLCA